MEIPVVARADQKTLLAQGVPAAFRVAGGEGTARKMVQCGGKFYMLRNSAVIECKQRNIRAITLEECKRVEVESSARTAAYMATQR